MRTPHEDIGKSNSQHRPALPTVSTGRRTAPRGHMVPVKLHRNLCLHSGKLLLGHPTLKSVPVQRQALCNSRVLLGPFVDLLIL